MYYYIAMDIVLGIAIVTICCSICRNSVFYKHSITVKNGLSFHGVLNEFLLVFFQILLLFLVIFIPADSTLLLVFYSFSLSLLSVNRLVLWGWGLRTDRVYITLSQPCAADLF